MGVVCIYDTQCHICKMVKETDFVLLLRQRLHTLIRAYILFKCKECTKITEHAKVKDPIREDLVASSETLMPHRAIILIISVQTVAASSGKVKQRQYQHMLYLKLNMYN